MTHEPEKSDPSTVAAKPANKSEGSDAESVERREGAEGNTNKDRMRRTPSRVSMSTGLERVRERAKAEKKERFTALLHHVDVDLLRSAFSRCDRRSIFTFLQLKPSTSGARTLTPATASF